MVGALRMFGLKSPFQWGAGGQKLRGDDIALQRRMAMQNMAAGSDYSPVQSPWQGLARVSQGLLGGLQMRDANRAADAEQTERQAVIAGLGIPENLAPAFADPKLADVAMELFKAQQPKAYEPGNDFERALIGMGLEPGSPEWVRRNAMRADTIGDRLITATLPGDRFFAGPESALASFLQGGGDPVSGVGGGAESGQSFPPPPQEAVLELLQNPSLAAQFDEVFGPGSSAQVFAAREGFREATGR